MKDLIEVIRADLEWIDQYKTGVVDPRHVKQAADLLERIYSQPVELPKAERIEAVQFCDEVYWFTADQLTQAVQEATARALEAAAKECKSLDNDENSSDYRAAAVWCAERVRNLIGRVK